MLMLDKMVNKWTTRIFLKKISFAMIISSFMIIVVMVAMSYYGMNVGDFVVKIEKDVISYLTLSENGDFLNNSHDDLRAKGLNDTTDSTYGYVPADIDEGYGSKNDDVGKRYMAYSFYLKNVSALSVNYIMSIRIVDTTRGVDDAIRVMVISESENQKTTSIYAKPRPDGKPEEHLNPTLEGVIPYTTKPFRSPSQVCQEINYSVVPDRETKYTIVMWLEGEDAECVDSIKGGTIKLEMKFTVQQ